jgi:hypothetical protein
MDTDNLQHNDSGKVDNILSWEEYKAANPPKGYEQSEKFGHYDQRVIDHYNNLYMQFLKANEQMSVK